MGVPTRYFGAGSPFEWFPDIGRGRQPYTSFPAGFGGLAAGPNGVAMGQFGWVDSDSATVSNVQSAGSMLVFVLPTYNGWNWQRVYPQPPVDCSGALPNLSGITPAPSVPSTSYTLMILRAGMQCIVATSGSFLTRFPLGGQVGSQVWADPATGLPYSSNLTGSYIGTPWTLMQSGGCGSQLRISSFTRPLN